MSKENEQTNEQPARTLKDYAILTAKGMAMGASDVVPGVSGGTMAFILGIYEELIDSIRTVGQPDFLQTVFKFRIKEIFEKLNWEFLLAVALGIFIAIFSLAGILESLLENQPVYLWSFFFGLVIASIITVSKRVSQWNPSSIVGLLLGAIGAYLLVGLIPSETPNTWWFLIFSGMIAICAMILPGISGSFILVLLGKYEFILNAVTERDIVSLGLVAIGAGVGIVTVAQLLGWLFKKYHDVTVAVLIGLMIGSLRKIWPWKNDVAFLLDSNGDQLIRDGHPVAIEQANYLPSFVQEGSTEIIVAFVLALVGFGVVVLLERLANSESA